MANSLLTINMITREAVRIFKNSNLFIQNIATDYDDQFARDGAKIGTALRIRLPNDYTVRTGAGISVQDTAEQSITMTLATQKGVDVSFSSQERTMSLDDYSERVLLPATNVLAGAVAADVMSGSEGGICNLVQNVDGTNAVLTPGATQYLQAGAVLDDNSARMDNRKVVNDPTTDARMVGALAGLFNPATEISRQFRSGKMKNALGFDWFRDQTVLKHVAGTFSAGGTVNGAGQTGTSITVNAITGTLKKGDIVTFAGVNAVNRVTKTSLGTLRQFVVTADVATLGVTIPVYPALVPAVGGVAVQYQTVDVSPANGAAMVLVNKASQTYRKSIAYAKEAVQLATADLIMPKKVEEAARAQYDGISMRIITDYITATDQMVTRMDILYGFLWVRPEWAVIVADSV